MEGQLWEESVREKTTRGRGKRERKEGAESRWQWKANMANIQVEGRERQRPVARNDHHGHHISNGI